MDDSTLVPRRSTLVPQVIEILRENINSGRWTVGSRLPLEAELLAQYKISRVTLRQAVQALVHVGMLETIQGNGTFVRATSEVETVLSRYLENEQLAYVLEARLAIEAQAAELAAARATTTDLDRMSTILAESVEAAEQDDNDRLVPLSAAFHQAVVDAAANPVLSQFYRALEEGTAKSLREISNHQPLSNFVKEHAAILDAIREGRGEDAMAASRNHLAAVIHQHAIDAGINSPLATPSR